MKKSSFKNEIVENGAELNFEMFNNHTKNANTSAVHLK